MSAVIAIGWFFGLATSMFIVGACYGNRDLVRMFPEGQRWWMPWSRLAALSIFAVVVLANPFNGWLA